MNLFLRTNFGCTEAVIDDSSLKRFYQIAGILSGELRIVFTSKEDDFDAISWQFSMHNHQLTLHYSIYNGISIFPTKTTYASQRDNATVLELAHILEGKLLNYDINKNIA